MISLVKSWDLKPGPGCVNGGFLSFVEWGGMGSTYVWPHGGAKNQDIAAPTSLGWRPNPRPKSAG